MKLILYAIVATVVSGPLPAGGGVPPDSGRGCDVTRAEAAEVMAYVFEGKTRLAIAYLREAADRCDGQPFYLLLKSRVDREALTVDDEDKQTLLAESEPIHRDLERVIEVCSRRLENGDNGANLRLYRGLAWMSKSHLHAFARRFWAAGRDAKKGKSDLEAYLDDYPGDPLATGALGVFLYFADTIPSLFKYVSRLVLMPTGDRELGLRYIRQAANTTSFLQPEFEAVLASVNLLFEGKLEEGIAQTVGLIERYPANPRMAVPLALLLPFDPARAARNSALVDGTIGRTDGLEPDAPERYPLTLLDFLNVYAGRLLLPTEAAIEGLTRIADEGPDHPDWVGGSAAFELGRLLASVGRAADARTAFDWVGHNPHVGYLHEDAARMSKALAAIDRSVNVPASARPTEIYFGSIEDRRNAIDDLGSSAATPTSDFYLAEAEMLAGDLGAALVSYRGVVKTPADPWYEEFKLLASCRIAEIYGTRGEYDTAVRWLEAAMDHYQNEFLIDWVLEGRRRFYERLRDGRSTDVPLLISPDR